MRVRGHDIGVCSWSLRPRDVRDLIARVKQLELTHLHLALAMLNDAEDQAIEQLLHSGLQITAGQIGFEGEDYSTIAMIRLTGGLRPDEQWPARRESALRSAQIAQRLNVTKISMHAGFIPPSSDAAYETLLTRICDIALPMQDRGIELLLETGQEGASALLQFLNDLRCKNVYVNYDPADMIRYGTGDPIESINTLGRHIRHVHVRDAILSKQPRTDWGEEVPFGSGQVPPLEFLEALEGVGYSGPLVIERDSGEDRVRDTKAAIESLRDAASDLTD